MVPTVSVISSVQWRIAVEQDQFCPLEPLGALTLFAVEVGLNFEVIRNLSQIHCYNYVLWMHEGLKSLKIMIYSSQP